MVKNGPYDGTSTVLKIFRTCFIKKVPFRNQSVEFKSVELNVCYDIIVF